MARGRASGFGSDLAALVLRLFVAFVLVYGTQDNVFHRERMLEFRDFLAQHGFPYPLASAYLSVYGQFTTGILLALGLLTRPAALVVVVNFLVALFMVHLRLPFSANIAPLAMLVGGSTSLSPARRAGRSTRSSPGACAAAPRPPVPGKGEP